MKRYMNIALEEANRAFAEDEVPIGAVIVKDSRVIARAHNECRQKHDFTYHAELTAIRMACEVLQSAFLTGSEIYVTLEPCVMCAGAIINAKIKKVVYGCPDFTAGAMGGRFNADVLVGAGDIEYYGGIMEEEAKKLLSEFFRRKREKQ